MAGVQGLEPWKWRNQNPLPYHLAIPLYFTIRMAGVPGIEPGQWRDQNPLPYRLAIPPHPCVIGCCVKQRGSL